MAKGRKTRLPFILKYFSMTMILVRPSIPVSARLALPVTEGAPSPARRLASVVARLARGLLLGIASGVGGTRLLLPTGGGVRRPDGGLLPVARNGTRLALGPRRIHYLLSPVHGVTPRTGNEKKLLVVRRRRATSSFSSRTRHFPCPQPK